MEIRGQDKIETSGSVRKRVQQAASHQSLIMIVGTSGIAERLIVSYSSPSLLLLRTEKFWLPASRCSSSTNRPVPPISISLSSTLTASTGENTNGIGSAAGSASMHQTSLNSSISLVRGAPPT